jgi:hypothetical protein
MKGNTMPYVHERDCVLYHPSIAGIPRQRCNCGWPYLPCQIQEDHQRDIDEYREEMAFGGLDRRER